MSRSLAPRLKRIGTYAAGAFGVYKVAEFGKAVLQTAADTQNAKLVLEGLYGNAKKADVTFRQLKKAAKGSPIDRSQWLKGADTLAYLGIQGKESVLMMKRLTTAAIGSGRGTEGIDQMLDGLNRLSSQGKATADVVNQISQGGFALWSALAKHMHMTIPQVHKAVSAGKISMKEITDTIEHENNKWTKATARSAEKAKNSMKNQFLAAKNSVVNSISDMVEPLLVKLAPAIVKVAGGLHSFINFLSAHSAGISMFAKAVAAAGAAWASWRAISGAVNLLRTVRAQLGIVQVAAKGYAASVRGGAAASRARLAIMRKNTAALIRQKASLVASKVATLAMAAASKAYAIAQRLVNLAMRANPIGLIITALLALAAVIYEVIKHWDAIKKATVAAFDIVKNAIVGAFNWVKKHLGIILPIIATIIFGPIGGIVAFIITHWDLVKSVTMQVFRAIRNFFVGIWRSIKGAFVRPVRAIRRFLSGSWDAIRSVAVGAWNAIKAYFSGKWAQIRAVFFGAVRSIERWLSGAWRRIRGAVSSAWHAIERVFSGAWRSLRSTVAGGVNRVVGYMRGLPGRVVRALGHIGRRLVRSGRWLIDGMLNGIKAAMRGIGGWLRRHVWGPIVNGVKSLFGIHSPSSVFEGFGFQMIRGLVRGLIRSQPGKVMRKILGGAGRVAGEALGWLGNHGEVALDKLKGLTGAALSGVKSVGGKVGSFFTDLASKAFHFVFGGGGGGSTVALGKRMAAQVGWTGGQWRALRAMWAHESSWNPNARNPSSGAYGIPQALPASKMSLAAQHGNAAAQIAWGIRYIKRRYGTPERAWSLWQARSPHWYGSGVEDKLFTKPTLIGVGERGAERVSVTPVSKENSRAGASYGDVYIELSIDDLDKMSKLGDFLEMLDKERVLNRKIARSGTVSV
jgi:tape measure domain-containing protein